MSNEQPELSVERFKELTDDDLRRMADACFARAGGLGFNPMSTTHLLQAQFFLGEIDRREHERERNDDLRIAGRDYKMELVVIVLIGLEIVIGIGGIVFGIVEGNKQNTILNKMRESMEATASTSKDQAKGVADLTDEQRKSLDSLTKMNSQLQTSVKKTNDMAVAMQQQLKILQDEQAARQAELAKKPELELYVGETLLTSTTSVPLTPKELTAAKVVFDIRLRNAGNASATKGVLRVIAFGKDVSLESSSPFQRAYETQADNAQHAILINFDYLRPGINIPMSVTATYPAGQTAFSILFNVDADEIPAGTPLGTLIVTPPLK